MELPAGFRFHPTDEELVNHYLCKKCGGQPISVPIIAEIDLYKYDPWQLPEMAAYGEKEWYFFSPRDRKYPNGSRPNRAAGTGYWKATGADKPIGRPKALGIKKALVFYAGKAPKGIKTNWIMHEYRLANVDRSSSAGSKNNLRLDEWVLCRIYNKKGSLEKHLISTKQQATKCDEIIDQKPNIVGQQMKLNNSSSNYNEYMDHTTTSDSIPRLHTHTHTDSSCCSEHVVSPPSDKEVESQPKWNYDFDETSTFFQLEDDPFHFQNNQMDQDIFTYLHYPF